MFLQTSTGCQYSRGQKFVSVLQQIEYNNLSTDMHNYLILYNDI